MKLIMRYRPYLIYIAASILMLLTFELFKDNRAFAVAVAGFAGAYHSVSAFVCSFLPFSVAELMFTMFFTVIAISIAVTSAKVIRYGFKRISSLVRLALMLCSAGLTVCLGLSVFWGSFYYVESFEEKSGITPLPVTAQQLYNTTAYFIDRLYETRDKLTRTPGLVCAENWRDAIQKSSTLYRPLEKEYPFLEGREYMAKHMAYSGLFSALGFTGYFFPFTGESNINIDTPLALIPSTIAHEIAHVRGVAPEQTANFVAVRACELSGDAYYEYSGWLLGYIHLSNALYRADYEAWAKLDAKLPRQVKADLRADSAYWRQFESPLQKAADKAYSSFLQGYGQELGSKSYGACVDLLCAYYG